MLSPACSLLLENLKLRKPSSLVDNTIDLTINSIRDSVTGKKLLTHELSAAIESHKNCKYFFKKTSPLSTNLQTQLTGMTNAHERYKTAEAYVTKYPKKDFSYYLMRHSLALFKSQIKDVEDAENKPFSDKDAYDLFFRR